MTCGKIRCPKSERELKRSQSRAVLKEFSGRLASAVLTLSSDFMFRLCVRLRFSTLCFDQFDFFST